MFWTDFRRTNIKIYGRKYNEESEKPYAYGRLFNSAIELKPVEDKVLNKYDRMSRVYLQQNNPMFFDELVLTEQLFPHLYEVQGIAEKRVKIIMAGLLEKNPAQDKETDAMAWVWHMNTLKAMAEEVVVKELIYT